MRKLRSAWLTHYVLLFHSTVGWSIDFLVKLIENTLTIIWNTQWTGGTFIESLTAHTQLLLNDFLSTQGPWGKAPEVICNRSIFQSGPTFDLRIVDSLCSGPLQSSRAHRNTDAFGGLFITANRWPQCSSMVLISLGRLGRDLETALPI